MLTLREIITKPALDTPQPKQSSHAFALVEFMPTCPHLRLDHIIAKRRVRKAFVAEAQKAVVFCDALGWESVVPLKMQNEAGPVCVLVMAADQADEWRAAAVDAGEIDALFCPKGC